jgi:predicted amidophosphoribosyltransferase
MEEDKERNVSQGSPPSDNNGTTVTFPKYDYADWTKRSDGYHLLCRRCEHDWRPKHLGRPKWPEICPLCHRPLRDLKIRKLPQITEIAQHDIPCIRCAREASFRFKGQPYCRVCVANIDVTKVEERQKEEEDWEKRQKELAEKYLGMK